MILEGLTLRSVKVVGTLEDLEFSPKVTVICGPNRSGKTTVLRAIYAALYHKPSRVLGEALRAPGGGDPTVELRFRAGGESYRLVKRFAHGGTTELYQGTVAKEGSAALDALDGLTGVASKDARGQNPVEGGDVAPSKVASPHRWVFHGWAADESGVWTAKALEVLAKDLEGANATAGEQDSDRALLDDVKRSLRELRGEAPKRDPYRKGSEFDEAVRAHRQARERLERLERTLAEIDDRARGIEELEARLSAAEQKLETARKKRDDLSRRLDEVRRIEKDLADVCQEADRLERRIGEMEVLRSDLDAHRSIGAEVADLARRLEAAQEALAEAEGRRDEAQAAMRAAEARVAAYEALGAAREARRRIEELDRRLERLAERKAKLAAARARLEALPVVSDRDVADLERIEREVGNTRAALDALSAEVELLAAPEGTEVRAADAPLRPGEPLRVEDRARIEVDGVVLEVRAGAEDQRVELRTRLDAARERLRQKLEALGVEDSARAREVEAERARHEATVRREREEIERADSEEALRAERAECKRRIDEARDRFERLRRSLEATPGAAALDPWDALVGLADAALCRAREEADRSFERAREDLDRAAEGADRAADRVRRLEADHRRARERLTEIEGRIRARTEGGLPDDAGALDGAIAAAREARAQAEARSAELRERLGGETVAALEAEIDRTDAALEELGRKVADCRVALARERTVLEERGREFGGASGLREALQRARDEVRHAGRKLRGTAAKLLADLWLERAYQEARAALTARIDETLRDRIAGYLALAHPEVAVDLEIPNGAASGRDGAVAIRVRFPADPSGMEPKAWSAGSGEQIGVAARLALAESEAAVAGGTFVVFDDPLVNTDPATLPKALEMFRRAAERGVQIVVATCDEAGYAPLLAWEGTRTIRLGSRP